MKVKKANKNNSKRLVLHASNVHTGGGVVLLQALLDEKSFKPVLANLDARFLKKNSIYHDEKVYSVRPSIFDRIKAEWRLWRNCRAGDVIFFFNGMPPLFPVHGHVVIFLQNRLYIEPIEIAHLSYRTRIRIAIEKFMFRVLRYRVDEYIVQTPSMAQALKQWYADAPKINTIPFLDSSFSYSSVESEISHDFIYVADGEAHKNHKNLLRAWVILSKQGVFPSLALTIDARHNKLLAEINEQCARYGLKIKNLGVIKRSEIFRSYSMSKALIYPSKSESFGIPLVEAQQVGLSILASERDFVRDIIRPAESFDPESPVSIARAVKRFLNISQDVVNINTTQEFVDKILE